MLKHSRNNVAAMPRQSLVTLKAALGVRAQYTILLATFSLFAFQLIGIVVFSDTARAVAAPTVTTEVADSVTGTAATLHLRSSDALDLAGATYSFEYGTSDSYGYTAQSTGYPWSSSSTSNFYSSIQFPSSSVLSTLGWSGRLRTSNYGGVRDSAGNFYTAAWESDDSACRVMKFDADGNYVLQLGGTCTVNSPTELNRVHGAISVDANDNVYIGQPDSQYILKYAPNGDLLGNIDMGHSDGAYSLAIDDTTGSLYVMTEYNQRVLKYDNTGSLVSGWAATQLGSRDFGIPDTTVAVNSIGEVYVHCGYDGTWYADPQTAPPCEKIWRYDSNGSLVNEWSSKGNSMMYIDSADNIYTYGESSFVGQPSPQPAIFVYDHNGNEFYRFLFNAGGMAYMNGITNVDLVTGVIETVDSTLIPEFSSFYRKGSATLSDLSCGTTYHYRAKAVSNVGTSYGSDQTFTTTACPPTPITMQEFNATAYTNIPFSQYIQTTGDITGHTFDVPNNWGTSLPPGLSINSTTGEIYGTPTTAGTYTFPLALRYPNSSGMHRFNQYNTIQVLPPLNIDDTPLADAYVETSYNQDLLAFDNYGDVVYSLASGSLPEGLQLSSIGHISGTPVAGSEGEYTFTVHAHDDANSDDQEFTMVVVDGQVQEGAVDEQPPSKDAVSEDPAPQDTPDTADVLSDSDGAGAVAQLVPVASPQTIVAAQNSLFALAKRIPEPVAIGFPWLLLALALLLVSIQYYQVHSESLATKRMQAVVGNQERLVDEQNNFVALTTHYLHTPLTVMEGEISLMVKAGTLTQEHANKLKSTLTSLNAEAEAVLAQEEQGNIDA